MMERFQELVYIVQATHEIRAARGGYMLAATLIDTARKAFDSLAPFQPVVVGGFAVSVHGEPRATKDFDLAVAPDSWEGAISALLANGFVREKRTDFRGVVIDHFQLEGVAVDLLTFSSPELSQALHQKTTRHNLFGTSVEVVSPEVLIVLKLLSNRPKDLMDVESIRANTPQLDTLKIRDLLQDLRIFSRLPEGL
jgi:hypothetical protein